jgi:hypothetical protein
VDDFLALRILHILDIFCVPIQVRFGNIYWWPPFSPTLARCRLRYWHAMNGDTLAISVRKKFMGNVLGLSMAKGTAPLSNSQISVDLALFYILFSTCRSFPPPRFAFSHNVGPSRNSHANIESSSWVRVCLAPSWVNNDRGVEGTQESNHCIYRGREGTEKKKNSVDSVYMHL